VKPHEQSIAFCEFGRAQQQQQQPAEKSAALTFSCVA
jgi:hypothetical protein